MPNWCYTNVTFYSNNKAQIKKMYKDFKKIYDGQATCANGFGHGWLGDYANTYFTRQELIPKVKDEGFLFPYEVINCRGSIIDIDEKVRFLKEDPTGSWYAFSVQTETAWGVKMGLFWEIIQKEYPDIMIAYMGEESGCEVFLKYDPDDLFYPEEYYVDWFCEDERVSKIECPDNHYFENLDEARNYIAESFSVKIPELFAYQLEDLQEFLRGLFHEHFKKIEDYEKVGVYINEFQVCHPSEFEFIKSEFLKKE